MPRPSLRALGLSLALVVGSVASACAQRGEPTLRRVQIPNGGVKVAWRLEPGLALVGHVRYGSTRQVDGLDDPLNQAFECDATLQVQPEPTPDGAARIRVVLSNLDLDWGLPPSATYSPDDFITMAGERLAVAPMWIDVDPKGGVVATSPVPDDAPPELAELIVVLADAVGASFVVLPPKAVDRGDTWADARPRADAMGQAWSVQTRGQVAGLYLERESERQLVGLDLTIVQRHLQGSSAAERDGTRRVMVVTEGYPAELDDETREFSADYGTSFRKIRATWTRSREILPELVTPGTGQVHDEQLISDPCNPDYVGPKACDEPPPEDDDDGADDEPDDDDQEDAEDAEDEGQAPDPDPPDAPDDEPDDEPDDDD